MTRRSLPTTLAIAALALLASCSNVRGVDGLGSPVPLKAPSPTPTPSVFVPTSPIPRPVPYTPPSVAPVPVLTTAPPTAASTSLVACGAVDTEVVRGVTVKTTTKCYKVQGSSMSAIMAAVGRSGPTVDGKDAVASTNWQTKWSYTYGSSGDGTPCVLSSPAAELTIVFTYPDLTSPLSAATPEWNVFMLDDVIPHEQRHRAIAVDGAAEIVAKLGSLGTRPTCAQLKSAAESAAKKIDADTRAEQDAFDNKEAHV